MGINIHSGRYLLAEKKRGIEFRQTLTLGRQAVYMISSDYKNLVEATGATFISQAYAEDFLAGLGANPVTAMDFSDYEGAQLLHDANEPIDPSYHSKFDTVIDGGTLEHVFNFPVAIRNCMEMVKPGGHLILLTPWHNFAGHGFYEFSPELWWNILSEANGFEIERMMIVVEGYWYNVKNPAEIKQRIEIRTNDEVLLFVTAKKVKCVPIFQKWPQQSDYSASWIDCRREQVNSLNWYLKFKKIAEEKIPTFRRIQHFRAVIKREYSLRPANNIGLVRVCSSHDIPTSPDVCYSDDDI